MKETLHYKLMKMILRNAKAKYSQMTVDSPRDPTVMVKVQVGEHVTLTEFFDTITVFRHEKRTIVNKGDLWYNFWSFVMECAHENWEKDHRIDERDGYGSLEQYR